MVRTSAEGQRLTHHGLLHPSTADLAAALAPLVAGGLTRGEPVLAVLPAITATRLRTQLPAADLAGLHTADPGELYRHPGRVLRHYRAWIADTRPDGGPATIVAAPDPNGDDTHRALWMHIEAVTTLALAECDLTLVCAYPDDFATACAVRQAHPSMLNGAITPNPEHLSAEQFLASYPLPPPIELGEPDLTRIISHPAQLAELRQAVAAHAGLPAARRDDFVLAVTEIASNAVEHGAPPAEVRLWATPVSVICQVTDSGRYTQPMAGLLPPPATQRRGRGLWMAHQLCDRFYLWPHPTTVRLQMDRRQSATHQPGADQPANHRDPYGAWVCDQLPRGSPSAGFPQWRGASMSEDQPSSPEAMAERVATGGEQTNLGVGEEEPDPATAENPPTEPRKGNEKRD